MTDPWRIDSHKLLFHPERVAEWRTTGDCYPLYAEISPSGACNHRCAFCGLDFMGYKPRFLDAAILMDRIAEMQRLGLKSIMFAGEGEPFLHREMAAIAEHACSCGVDVSFTTNGVLLKPAVMERILPVSRWIKVSINAGTSDTYSRVHRTDSRDFERVFTNLREAVRSREKTNGTCTLGAQMLLLPENLDEAETLARRCRETGLDYLVLKPFSQHPQSINNDYASLRYDADLHALGERLQQLGNDTFHLIFRAATMERWNTRQKPYSRCRALPFWTYIDAGGNVWGCSVYLGDDRFLYGNINDQTFKEIWKGEKRRASLAWCADSLDPASCRINCRMDPVNIYLEQLACPPPHVNFI